MNESLSRGRLALGLGGILCVGLGLLTGGPYGDFVGGVALGMLSMLLGLHLASRWPLLNGSVPGLLGA